MCISAFLEVLIFVIVDIQEIVVRLLYSFEHNTVKAISKYILGAYRLRYFLFLTPQIIARNRTHPQLLCLHLVPPLNMFRKCLEIVEIYDTDNWLLIYGDGR